MLAVNAAAVWQTACIGGSRHPQRPRQMQPETLATTNTRPNRVLIALAAAWMIVSLAVGGVIGAGQPASAAPANAITEAVQP